MRPSPVNGERDSSSRITVLSRRIHRCGSSLSRRLRRWLRGASGDVPSRGRPQGTRAASPRAVRRPFHDRRQPSRGPDRGRRTCALAAREPPSEHAPDPASVGRERVTLRSAAPVPSALPEVIPLTPSVLPVRRRERIGDGLLLAWKRSPKSTPLYDNLKIDVPHPIGTTVQFIPRFSPLRAITASSSPPRPCATPKRTAAPLRHEEPPSLPPGSSTGLLPTDTRIAVTVPASGSVPAGTLERTDPPTSGAT